jgi:hypothetical protein
VSDGSRVPVLEGNGALLVRGRARATTVQNALERLYQLDRVADVHAFLLPAEEGEREALLVREANDGTLEMALRVPMLGPSKDLPLDPLCQIIEGVSHFVYLADRARADREATQLEMEMQAEVDKYVVLASATGAHDLRASAKLRERLYERVDYAHDEETELGERYRVANDLAHGFVRRLEVKFVADRKWSAMRDELRRFFRMGQAEKMRLGRAA